jgi:hypothetical protein
MEKISFPRERPGGYRHPMGTGVRVNDPVGTSFSEMDEGLRHRLERLFVVYLGRMGRERADDRPNRIERGWN